MSPSRGGILHIPYRFSKLHRRETSDMRKMALISCCFITGSPVYMYNIVNNMFVIINKRTILVVKHLKNLGLIGIIVYGILQLTDRYIVLIIVNARPSQIACMVTTVHVTCMETVLHVHENLCTVLIPLCKNNLNLTICSFFSVLCLVAFSHSLCCHACYFAVLCCFFCLFVLTENDFVAQP